MRLLGGPSPLKCLTFYCPDECLLTILVFLNRMRMLYGQAAFQFRILGNQVFVEPHEVAKGEVSFSM